MCPFCPWTSFFKHNFLKWLETLHRELFVVEHCSEHTHVPPHHHHHYTYTSDAQSSYYLFFCCQKLSVRSKWENVFDGILHFLHLPHRPVWLERAFIEMNFILECISKQGWLVGGSRCECSELVCGGCPSLPSNVICWIGFQYKAEFSWKIVKISCTLFKKAYSSQISRGNTGIMNMMWIRFHLKLGHFCFFTPFKFPFFLICWLWLSLIMSPFLFPFHWLLFKSCHLLYLHHHLQHPMPPSSSPSHLRHNSTSSFVH